jgi:hypothetical protein
MPRLKATRETSSVSCGFASPAGAPRHDRGGRAGDAGRALRGGHTGGQDTRRPAHGRPRRSAHASPTCKTVTQDSVTAIKEIGATIEQTSAIEQHGGASRQIAHHVQSAAIRSTTRPRPSATLPADPVRPAMPRTGYWRRAVDRGRSPQDRSRKIPALGARRAAQICPMAASRIPIATASPSERLATWHNALPTPLRSNPRDYVPSRAHGRRYRPGRHHTDEL